MHYQHYKGEVYELICEARLAEEPKVIMIVYRAVDGSIWARPSEKFFGMVEFDGKMIPRFMTVET